MTNEAGARRWAGTRGWKYIGRWRDHQALFTHHPFTRGNQSLGSQSVTDGMFNALPVMTGVHLCLRADAGASESAVKYPWVMTRVPASWPALVMQQPGTEAMDSGSAFHWQDGATGRSVSCTDGQFGDDFVSPQMVDLFRSGLARRSVMVESGWLLVTTTHPMTKRGPLLRVWENVLRRLGGTMNLADMYYDTYDAMIAGLCLELCTVVRTIPAEVWTAHGEPHPCTTPGEPRCLSE